MLYKANIQGDLKDKILYEISHNPTDGILDLYEAAKQTHDIAWSAFWRILGGIDPMPDFIQDNLKIISARYDEDMVKSYPSIQKHTKKYNADLCRGDKVVVVAHSQGNLYANIAYKGIEENVIDGFGIVSVANPSWYVAGDNSDQFYTTIDEDLVIGFIPGALGSNVNNFNGLNLDDLSGHMFIGSYLAPGKEAESKILEHIVLRIYNLEWPEGDCDNSLLYVKSNSFCIVWDVKNDKMFEGAKKNDGTDATFPILESEISDWKATLIEFGAPAIRLSVVNSSPVFGPAESNNWVESNCRYSQTSLNDSVTVSGYGTDGPEFVEATKIVENIYIDDVKSEMAAKQDYEYHISNPYGSGSMKIKSLSNAGGVRGRTVNYDKKTEQLVEWNMYGTLQCADLDDGDYILSTISTELNFIFKSPFSDKSTETTTLLSESIYNHAQTNCNISVLYSNPFENAYNAAGVIGDLDFPYIVVFYAEKFISKEESNFVCARVGYGIGPSDCQQRPCKIANSIDGYTTHFDNVKAFIGSTTEDPMDLDPFEVPMNNLLATALENLISSSGSIYLTPSFLKEID